MWLCARDPAVGWPPRLLALLVAGYALSPIDLIPDFIPLLGLLDDAVLIPLGLWLLRRMIPDAVYRKNMALAKVATQQPVSIAAAVVIIGLWVAAVVSCWIIWHY